MVELVAYLGPMQCTSAAELSLNCGWSNVAGCHDGTIAVAGGGWAGSCGALVLPFYGKRHRGRSKRSIDFSFTVDDGVQKPLTAMRIGWKGARAPEC